MTPGDFQQNSEPANGNWSIRPADWRDYVQLNDLERSCFSSEDHWPIWDLLGVLTLPGMVRIKAVAGGMMVGFIGGEREAAKRRGWVTTLAVLPSYRRQGIAMALLDVCEAKLAMPVIRLSVRESNTAAIGLYKSAGYALVDRWKNYYIGGEAALVFEKRR